MAEVNKISLGGTLYDIEDTQARTKANAAIQGALMTGVPFLYASNKRELTIRAGAKFSIGSGASVRLFYTDVDVVLNVASILDTGSLANGKDYYLFGCPDSGNGVIFKISLTKTNPQGFSQSDVRLIGGFHTLCVAVGAGLTYAEGANLTKAHPLSGYAANDILPMSVWCLNHRPYCEPEGMVYIPTLDFWCDIYLQSGSGANTKSVYQGELTRSRQFGDHVEDMLCVKKELLSDSEFAAAIMGSNEKTAVQGASEAGATSGGAGGRVDTAGRRMISIWGVEEGCGSIWQWCRDMGGGGNQGGIFITNNTSQAVSSSAHGPFAQSGDKGQIYGLAIALLAGGHWLRGAACGSRCRGASESRSHGNAYFGGRGRSHPRRVCG